MSAKPMRLWALMENGQLRDSWALRTRRHVKLQAAMGMMGAGTFENICRKHRKDYQSLDVFVSVHPGNYALIRDLWAEVKRGNPTVRLVQVECTPLNGSGRQA